MTIADRLLKLMPDAPQGWPERDPLIRAITDLVEDALEKAVEKGFDAGYSAAQEEAKLEREKK